jgi:nucleotide-binding universal stress UspA family protein
VVGFDDSPASHDALAYAIGWARRVGGSLDVVHVSELSWRWVALACGGMGPVGELPVEKLDGRLGDLSGAVADALTATGLAWTFHAGFGGVVTALDTHAQRVGADVIIVGKPRHRATALRTSIAHRLVSCSNRIVIIVP